VHAMRSSAPDGTGGDPADRHVHAVNALRQAVFQSPGSTELVVRGAAGSGGELPEPMADQVASSDVDAVRAAGVPDEAIVERCTST
jgi:hypothetical protein